MERVLGILGSAVLLSVLSLMFLIVDAQEPSPSDLNITESEERGWSDLSDGEKLDRLNQDPNISDDTLLNRAQAYNDATYCDGIDNTAKRETCQETVRSVNETGSGSQASEADQRRLNRAVAYDDPSYCDDITSISLQDRCTQRVG